MEETVDFSKLGELERLEYISKELEKEKHVRDADESGKDYKIRLKQFKRDRSD